MTQQGTEKTGADEEFRPIPDEIREAGRLAPDHWLGVVDPMWSGEGKPPEWVMVGRWRSGLDGEIEEWQDNPDYRPSPSALGWPEPEDEVDRAVQLAVTGYGPGEAVTEALLGREVAVLTSPEGGPLSAVTPDGAPVVPLFTSPAFLHTAGRLAFELISVDDLVSQVPDGHALYLNPSGPAGMTLELEAVRDAVRGSGPPARPVPTVSGDATPAASVESGDRTADAATDMTEDSRRSRGTEA
ncbi:type VII secretion system-associated protein [Streptomyces sp. NBC_01373]|uniref:type VII secretion system-associated protein n=1 Tax=unclassified Streptomyces TaxID=2593676 RepID=UPI00225B54DE|nr:type VII secretion system-associated protein [Streptomyces sp. NBC_01373]MCX4703064.1 type VII secretion system-associated protein [Streptomyces sp. NBC_01373]